MAAEEFLYLWVCVCSMHGLKLSNFCVYYILSYEVKQRIRWSWENLEVRKPRYSPILSERGDSLEGKKSRELEFGTLLLPKPPCKTS